MVSAVEFVAVRGGGGVGVMFRFESLTSTYRVVGLAT